VYPRTRDNPLLDHRVQTHVDDGRFFLLATQRRYDLITSEPPPPKHAGVVNLYTREFYQLVFDRLEEGGINTHWLPVHSLTHDETRAIVRAYCEVFQDCTLWKGIGLNWMLMGSRSARWQTSEVEFAERWERLRHAREDRELAVEVPEQLGAMFMGDAPVLLERVGDVPPLTDDFPKRLGDDPPGPEDVAALRRWMDPETAAARFRVSPFVERAWPDALRAQSDRYFEYDGVIDKIFFHEYGRPPALDRVMPTFDGLLSHTGLETLPMWLISVYGDHLAAIDRNPGLRSRHASRVLLGGRALCRRNFAQAARLLGRSQFLGAYATAMAGNTADAAAVVRERRLVEPSLPWDWLEERFALEPADERP
jgi:hypothetical protein